jgi:hypothetical protein
MPSATDKGNKSAQKCLILDKWSVLFWEYQPACSSKPRLTGDPLDIAALTPYCPAAERPQPIAIQPFGQDDDLCVFHPRADENCALARLRMPF